MSNIPENLRYSKDHEWVLVDGDVATIASRTMLSIRSAMLCC